MSKAKPSDMILEMGSGNKCRVTFKVSGDAVATGLMWDTPPTPEDQLLAEAVVMEALRPHLAPTAEIHRPGYVGKASEAEHQATLDRFLKAGNN